MIIEMKKAVASGAGLGVGCQVAGGFDWKGRKNYRTVCGNENFKYLHCDGGYRSVYIGLNAPHCTL